jgi:hypothetical protein
MSTKDTEDSLRLERGRLKGRAPLEGHRILVVGVRQQVLNQDSQRSFRTFWAKME